MKNKYMTNIKIKKNEEKPESKEILAEAITRISEALEKLAENDLNEQAIVVLLQDMTPPIGSYPKRKISKKEISLILKSLKKMRSWYCK